eukprot:TRINITY_DN2295_c0_g1_i20.p1 TRINITY_DN2295_c0_g1~~TRINITY_DN2295_c0_g1_i20.p1  ORF type:complete len:309 (-),score=70.87 TRINITY_DN2295_c0_g1_i20:354-1280(-)
MTREFSNFKTSMLTGAGLKKSAPQAGVKKQVVTMDGALHCQDLNLKPLLKSLLKIGSDGFECPVEIEFAVNLSNDPQVDHEFVLLQTRPMSMWKSDIHHGFDTLPESEVSIISTSRALGNGPVMNIRDIVFIDPDNFEPSQAQSLVPVLAGLNQKFKEQGAHYLLIVPGRIGTQQENMGIPVQWSDICETRCIVETDIQGMDVPPSEGTHFFQNLVSFGIAYFTVYKTGPNNTDEGHVDHSWLKQMLPAHVRSNSEVVRTVHLEAPLEIVVDGVTGCGVVMRPPHEFSISVAQQSAFNNMDGYQHSRL